MMADEDQGKAEASAEKAYAAAAEALPLPAEETPATVEAAVESEVEPVAFPPKGKRGRKPRVVAEAATPEPLPLAVEPEPEFVAQVEPVTAVTPEPAPLKIAKARPARVAAKPRAPKAAAKPAAKRKPAASTSVPARAAARKPVTIKPPVALKPVVPKPAIAAKVAVGKKKPVVTPTKPQAGVSSKFLPFTQIKDKTMDITSTFTDGLKGVVSDAQAKAKEAFEKSSAIFSEYNEFAKGNVEAAVESGKIFATGLQGMGTTFVAESKSAFETMTSDVKELSAAKTPADFFKLQSDLFRRNFDSAVAYGSKNSEAVLKLANEVMAPLSGRVSLAVEKVRKAA
jgi:phasin family protein